jgi:hypothetical protein
MNELESGLHKVLEEHQHESGLHIIGGRNRLIARLTEFFEQLVNQEHPETPHTRGISH